MKQASWIRRMRWRARRALERINPIRVFRDWQYDGYRWSDTADGPVFKVTWRVRVGDAVIWKWDVLMALGFAAFSRSSEELWCLPWWQRPLYRLKAIICLLSGLHWKSERYAWPRLEIAWWDGALVGYCEPEWESSTLHVGEGWRNWWVELDLRLP